MFQSYGGFPDVMKVPESVVSLQDPPGMGFEAKPDLYLVMLDLA